MNTTDDGRLPSGRATHEQSPQAVSAVPVGIADAIFREPSEDELNEGARNRFARFGPFNLDRWPASVTALSMPTHFIPIDDPEAFLALYDRKEGWVELAQRYAAMIDAHCQWNNHFVKLNSRSPKDASYPEVPITMSGKQAMSWILSSERCIDDIVTMWRAGEPVFICLREWRPIRPQNEIRCFAKDGKLIGVSRYDYRNIPEFNWEGKKVLPLASAFYRDHLAAHYETVVFDLALQSGEPLLIELNPYGLSDPCCFESYETLERVGGFLAQAIEARRAETGTGSVEDESAGRQASPKGQSHD